MTKQDELNFYGEWSTFLVELLESRSTVNPFPGMQTELIRDAMAAGNLRGLKMVPKDLAEGAKAFSKSVQRELEAAMLEKFGVGLSDRMKKQNVAIGVIIARGAIKDESERQLLQARANEIQDNTERQGELRAIVRLLHA